MDEKTRDVLMERLNKIIGKLAMQDYLKVNTSTQGKLYKKHHSYSLSQETERAKDLYNILFFNDNFENLTKEQEEEIKGYLLSNRILWQD